MNLTNTNQTTCFDNLRTQEWYEGFINLRKRSLPESKLGIPEVSDSPVLEFVECTTLAEKLKWTDCFRRAYQGHIKPLPSIMYGRDYSRVFVAKTGDKELGYMRISNHNWQFGIHSKENVWCISEVYVKPPYRKQNIAARLMQHAITYCHAKAIYILKERYENKKQYFNELGFAIRLSVNPLMCYVYLEDFIDRMQERLEPLNQKSQ